MSRFLYGLLPQVLLDDYSFWQNVDDSLTGYLSAKAQTRLHANYILKVELKAKAGILGAKTRGFTLPENSLFTQFVSLQNLFF